MKQVLILFGLSFFFFSACKNETCITGTVVNGKNGQPIEDATVEIRYEYTDHGSLLSGTDTKETNTAGQFSFCVEDAFNVGIAYVGQSGYAEKYGAGTPIQDGEENNVEIKLMPLDGVLKLKITNTAGIHDSICVEIVNKCEYVYYKNGGSHRLDMYPLKLKLGDSYEESFATCEGEYTYIRWDFKYLQSSLPHRDSILITTNDTTFYNIDY